MSVVTITVAAVNATDPKAGCRWSVSQNGQEVEHGIAADEDAAYAAAKPFFDSLRAEMARAAQRGPDLTRA